MQAPMEKLDSRFRRSLILWIRMTMYWYRITRERESEIRAPAGQSSAVDIKPLGHQTLTYHSKVIKNKAALAYPRTNTHTFFRCTSKGSTPDVQMNHEWSRQMIHEADDRERSSMIPQRPPCRAPGRQAAGGGLCSRTTAVKTAAVIHVEDARFLAIQPLAKALRERYLHSQQVHTHTCGLTHEYLNTHHACTPTHTYACTSTRASTPRYCAHAYAHAYTYQFLSSLSPWLAPSLARTLSRSHSLYLSDAPLASPGLARPVTANAVAACGTGLRRSRGRVAAQRRLGLLAGVVAWGGAHPLLHGPGTLWRIPGLHKVL